MLVGHMVNAGHNVHKGHIEHIGHNVLMMVTMYV